MLLSAAVFSLTPGVAYAKGKEAITTDALNFRDSGSINSNVLDVVPMGEKIEVLETSGKWAQVKFGNKTGWISANYIVYTEDVKAMVGITNIKVSKLRKSASATGGVLATLKVGSLATLTSIENGWFKINSNGTTGYVYASEWIVAPSAPVVSTAKPATPVTGKIEVYSNITVYMNASDADAGKNDVGTYAAGEYYIYKNFAGMINITKHENVPGAWINPLDNKDNAPIASQSAKTTQLKPITKPATTTTATKPVSVQATNDKYTVVTPLSTYTNAYDAIDRTNAVGQYATGTYYIYKNFSGMLNITKTKGKVGAWINPAQNVVKTPPASTTPSTKPPTTTTPATKPPTTTTPKPLPDMVIANATVNFRKDASNVSTILKTLPAGAKASMIGKDSNWIKIEYQGQIGYTYITYWDIPAATLAKFTPVTVTKPVVTKPAGSTTLPKFNPTGTLKVYLDPGHMGVGQGAVSTVTGELVDENTINYRVAVLTKEILESRGYKVYISKNGINDPVGLIERSQEANKLNVDIFVSIHCNSFSNSAASGTLGFWAGEKLNPAVSDWQSQSKALAEILAKNVGSILGSSSAPSDVSYGSSFSVNRNSQMPSALLELGFITNFQDATILNASASQQKIAVQIANGIDKFFGK